MSNPSSAAPTPAPPPPAASRTPKRGPNIRSRASSMSSRSRSSVSSSGGSGGIGLYHGGGLSSATSSGSIIGSSCFQVGRSRDRSAEMELFCRQRKPRSNYRRPSSLGLSCGNLAAKTETRATFTNLPVGRGHIVPKIPDNLKPGADSFSRESEIRAKYRNMSPQRPFIHRIPDSLKPEGPHILQTETKLAYENKNASRPYIHRLNDHGEQVQPRGLMDKSSEYRTTYTPGIKGERVNPPWMANFAKVAIDGGETR